MTPEPPTVHASAPDAVALAYWDAEQRRDLDEVMTFFSDDAVFYTPERTWRGWHEIRQRYAEMIAEYPGLRVSVGWVIVDVATSRAALQWSAVLTDLGGLDVTLEGVNLVETRNGRFTEVRCLFDPNASR